MGGEEEGDREGKQLVFTYGTLKKGFPNHGLMQELIGSGNALSLGEYCTWDKYPLVCGPYKVPFLINLAGHGHRVWGELYAVSVQGLVRMDDLEGTGRGHYERLPMVVVEVREGEEEDEVQVQAEAYYAHRSYGEELWNRSGKRGISCYSHNEAIGYVKRTDRPSNITFLDQIRFFLAPPPPSSPPSPPSSSSFSSSSHQIEIEIDE